MAGRAGEGGGAGAATAGRLTAGMVVSGRPLVRRFLSAIRVAFEIILRVSSTPEPLSAEASQKGQLPRLSDSFISSTVQMLARSRLLYWSTTGTVSSERPISARFSSRFWNDSMLACTIGRCESATKTTPSTPLSTNLRVVL